MLPDRSSAAAFPIGAAVEVRSNDAGFNGSWYEATVVQLRPKLRACDVEYVTLVTTDDPSRPLRETVLTRHVRPRGRRLAASAGYAVDDLVYAFHNDGWWPGVVSAMHGGDPPERYTVSFPNSREMVDCAPSEIRPRMEWKQGRWFPLENKSECQFKMGDNVEVSGDKENYGAVWFNGTVVKVIAKTILLVEYTRCKGDGSQEVLREFLDTQYVRPVPLSKPVGKRLRHQSKHFALAEELEVYHCGGWMLGVVSRIVDNSRYIVKLRHGKEEEIDAGHYEMRKLSNWTNGKWVYPTKNHGRPSRGRPTYAGKNRDMPHSISSSSSTDVAQPKTASLKRKMREEPNSEGQTETQLPNKEPRKTDPSAMEIDPKTPAVDKEAHVSKQDFESPPSDMDIGSPHVEAGLIEKLDKQIFPKGDSIAEVVVDASNSTNKVSKTQSPNHSLSAHETGFCVRQTDWGDFNSVRNPWTSVPMRRKKLAIRPRQDAHDVKHSFAETSKKIVEPLKVSRENTVSTNFAGTETEKQPPKGVDDQVVEGKESVTGKLSDHDMCENSPSTVAAKDIYSINNKPNEPVGILADQHFTPQAQDNASVSVSTETLPKIPSCNGSTIDVGIKAPLHPMIEDLAIARSISSDAQVKETSTFSIIYLPFECNDATGKNGTRSSVDGCDGMTTDVGMTNPPHPVKDDCAISRAEETSMLDKAADGAVSFGGNGVTEKNHGPSERPSVDEMVFTNQAPVVSSQTLPFEGNGATDTNGNGATEMNHGPSEGPSVDEIVLTNQAPVLSSLTLPFEGNGVSEKNHEPSERPSVDEIVSTNQAYVLSSPALPFEGNGVTERNHGPSERPSVDEMVSTNQAPVQPSLAHQFDGNGVNHGPSERHSENVIVLTDQAPSSSVVRALPFDKSSFLWESIESMEIFRRLPQEPHFGALEQQYPREFREGMAIGMMTTFAKLEADIRELDAFHSREVFEDKTKALKYLEDNGFTVQILQSRINDLLEVRNSLSEIEKKERTLKDLVQEKEHEKVEIHTLKYLVDKTIKEREQQLTLLVEKRDALVAREVTKDSELAELRKDADAMEEAYLAALERFRTVSAAPW